MTTAFEKRKVLFLSMTHTLTDGFAGFLAPLLPLLMDMHGLSVTQAAALNSTLAFSASFLQPLFGFIADRTRKTHFLFLGPLIAAVFLSSLNLANSFTLLLIFVFLGGVGIAAFHPVGATMARHYSGTRHNTGMSWFVTGGNLGFSTGAIVITSIVAIGGLQAAHFMIIPALFFVYFLWRILPSGEYPAPGGNNNNHSKFSTRTALGILIVIVTIRALVISGFVTFIPIFAAQQGSSLSVGGINIFVFLGIGGIGAFSGGIIADKIGEKVVILLSFIVPIPFFILYTYLSFPYNLGSLAIGSICLFSSISVVISVAQTIFLHRIGTVSSIVMGFCWGLGGLLIIPFGPLAEYIGIGQTLNILACILLLGLIASLALYTKSLSSMIITTKTAAVHLHAT